MYIAGIEWLGEQLECQSLKSGHMFELWKDIIVFKCGVEWRNKEVRLCCCHDNSEASGHKKSCKLYGCYTLVLIYIIVAFVGDMYVCVMVVFGGGGGVCVGRTDFSISCGKWRHFGMSGGKGRRVFKIPGGEERRHFGKSGGKGRIDLIC